MAITLKTLINVAPFPDNQKQALIDNIGVMTEDQKYRLSNTAWSALAQMYYGRLAAGRMKIINEVLLKQREPNANDYQELEAKLLHEFAHKLEAADTQTSIEEVRQQLAQFKTKPLQKDVASSPPPDKS